MINCDVIIMVTESHVPMLKRMLPYCRKNVVPRIIYVVAGSKIKQLIEEIEGVIFVDEDSIFDGLTYDTVADLIEKRTGERKRAGWYFQQFLKLAWAYRCKDDYYISLDADTFVLSPIEYIYNGKYLFTAKTEYNEPYFVTLNRLFDGRIERKADFSFIAENMIFDCSIVKEMLAEIESNSNLDGRIFFEKILYAIDADVLLESGFSEFETYGNFIITRYPEKTKTRKLRTMRESLVLLGGNPTKEQLEWAARDYDMISIESAEYKRTLITLLTRLGWFRRCISFRKLAVIRYRVRTHYRKIVGKDDYKLESYE